MLSAAFAFAQATGLGGTTGAGRGAARIEEMEAVKERVVKVTFNADVHSSLQWNFRPQQSEIYVSGFPPLRPSNGAILTKAARRLGVLPHAVLSPHVPLPQGARFVHLGADL